MTEECDFLSHMSKKYSSVRWSGFRHIGACKQAVHTWYRHRHIQGGKPYGFCYFHAKEAIHPDPIEVLSYADALSFLILSS